MCQIKDSDNILFNKSTFDKIQYNIKDITIITIKHLPINKSMAFDNSFVDMSLTSQISELFPQSFYVNTFPKN